METMEARRSTSLSSIASITSLSPWMRSIDELRILYANSFYGFAAIPANRRKNQRFNRSAVTI